MNQGICRQVGIGQFRFIEITEGLKAKAVFDALEVKALSNDAKACIDNRQLGNVFVAQNGEIMAVYDKRCDFEVDYEIVKG